MSSDGIFFWAEDVQATCSECGKESTFNVDFEDASGDERLNFFKIRTSIAAEETCPHCGNIIQFDIRYWQREFYGKKPDGRQFCRGITLWKTDYTAGASTDAPFREFEATAVDHLEELRLNFADAFELIDNLRKVTQDEGFVSVRNALKEKEAVYAKMRKATKADKAARDQFEIEAIDSVIPELKRLIDAHEDVLKDAYLGDFLP